MAAAAGLAGAAPDGPPITVRITSPLGRTGVPGAVRIVAQVAQSTDSPVEVKFFVNKTLVGTDGEGPVYAVEWADENPFVPTEIAVEAARANGGSARDTIQLPAFEFTEATQILSVLLEATVQDKHGRFVTGLRPEQFSVEEDGVAQQLDVVRPETLPATYAIVVDASQSMARRVGFLHDAAGRLASFLGPEDRVLVVPFSKTLGAITGPTADRATIAQAVADVRPRGGTAIFDAVIATSRLMGNIEGRRVIVLLSDGYDEHSSQSFEAARTAAQSAGCTVYVIGIGGVAGISLKGERLLRQLAADTGGRAFFPYREEQLPDVHGRVASEVSNRYLITYTSTNQRIDGTWRHVTLSTSNAAYRVQTKPGYFAPQPPPVRPVIEFTVTDTAKRHLSVSAADLTIVEDGVEQQVDAFQESTGGVSIMLVLDQSGSMRKAAEGVRTAARSFVDALRSEDRLAVIRFSDSPVLAHDLSTDRTTSAKAIDEYEATGGTALYDAVHTALGRLQRVEGRRALVVLTDGRDENNAGTGPGSIVKLDDVRDALRETQAVVFTIGLGTNVDRTVLEELATTSGGESYFPETPELLAAEYARIVENLRRRYVVSYTSTNFNRDGAWRSVEIRSQDPAVRVVSRGGYFAPED